VFVARCEAGEPVLRGVTEDEIALMKEIRWWRADEVEASTERIFPVDLAARMRGIREAKYGDSELRSE